MILSRAPRLFGPAFVVGVALSGFFDGVLLHQILQWHHLLSLVPGQTMQRLTTQILADGLFHAVMYIVAAVGGVWLWRRRDSLAAPAATRHLMTGLLAGFGAWNVWDVIVFHWVLGLHHLRLGVAEPLLWDAGWLILLGLAPIAVSLHLARRPGDDRGGRPAAFAALAGLAVLGAWASRPPPGSQDTLAVFAPGVDPTEVMAAVIAVDGRLVQAVGDGSIVVLRLPEAGRSWQLYRHGAILVSATGPAGCLTWSKPAAASIKA